MGEVPAAVRVVAGLGLLVVAASSPVMGVAAAEEFSGRKFFGLLEGDWFALFGIVAAGACLWCAFRLVRARS